LFFNFIKETLNKISNFSSILLRKSLIKSAIFSSFLLKESLTRGCMWGPTLEKYIFIESNTTFFEYIKFCRKMVYLCMRTKKKEKKKGGKNYSSQRKSSNKGISLNFLGLQKHMKCCVKGQNVWIYIFEFFWWKKYVSNKSW